MAGGGALWTLRSAFDFPADVRDGTWSMKIPWFTKPFGLPTITARRLDGVGTFRSEPNAAFDASGKWVSGGLQFSAPGCWEITSRYRESSLRVRLRIGA